MFLSARKFESNNAVRGAFLLTDAETKPLEFRCTDPIRPTQLQKMLYGDILEQYILVELIGQPLVKTVKDEPNLILVNDYSFLELRTKINTPIVQITKEEQINVASDKDESNFQMLNSASGKFDPIVIRTHSKFPDDKNRAKEILSGIFNSYDLIEPFNRVSTALEQVHVQKIGEV
jgi:hypothetical protein